jgi:O-antigen ligase
MHHSKAAHIFLLAVPVLFGTWLLVTALTDTVPGIGTYNSKRILELYLILLTLCFTAFSTHTRHLVAGNLGAIPGWMVLLLVLWLGLGASSALLTAHPAYPLIDVAMFFIMGMTAMAIAGTRQALGTGFDRVVLFFLALMGLGVFIQELIGLSVYLSTGQQFNTRESLMHFFHPRLYNQVQTWTIPLLALLPIVFGRTRFMSVLSVFLIGGQWYILFSTGARGSVISLVVAMLVIGLAFSRSRRFWLRLHLAALALGVLFYVSAVGMIQARQPDTNEFVAQSVGRPLLHTTGRTDFWKHALDDARQNPWLGSGPLHFGCDASHALPGSPHNLPLQIAGGWGIPAFLVLMMLALGIFRGWYRAASISIQRLSYHSALASCLSISCLAASIHVWVSSLLIPPPSQVAAVLVVGWLLGILLSGKKQSPGNKTESLVGSVLVQAVALLIIAVILFFSHSELDELEYRTAYARDYGPTAPGFWVDGRFCEYSFE